MHLQVATAIVAAISLADAIPTLHNFKRSLTNDSSSITSQSYDYIIAGGGLTGLTTASILSQGPSISVLVIEQGYDQSAHPYTYDVRTYGQAFANPDFDHAFQSTPIPWRNGETLPLVAGKMLGGSGSLNGASWTKGPKTQYDALPMLTGDDSWGFKEFNKYMLRAEKFNEPNETMIAKGSQWIGEYHGYDGHVDVSFAAGMFGYVQSKSIAAAQKLWGLKVNKDAASGTVNGVTTIPNMLHPDEDQKRCGPYQSYILEAGALKRPNLSILLGHRVTQIMWEDEQAESLKATGVQFQHSPDSEVLTVKANREVLVATGSLQSPQLLELSGVGDPAVLEPAGIKVVKTMQQVGRNFQEQTKNAVQHMPYDNQFAGSGPPSAIAFPNVYQVLGDDLANETYHETLDALPAWAQHLEDSGYVLNAKTYLPILQTQLDNLFMQREAAVEQFFTVTPSTGQVGIDLWNLIVLSRGSVHISSSDPWAHPLIDPAYFQHPLDLQLQTHATIQAREVYGISPLSDLINYEMEPGLERVPANASYVDWQEYVMDSFTSVWHPISTLAMMKEELGGVVDNRLKVYGMENVRVVDASVLPVQLSAHLSSSLYGIAEKASEMIQQDWA